VSRRLALACAVLALASAARAAGPLLVNPSGVPFVWRPLPVPFNPDRGNLGTLSNATAVAHVAANFAVWTAVPTANLTVVNAGALPVDVTVANYTAFLGVCGDGLSPIVFDTDGSITDDLLGNGARNEVLGFAGPECADVNSGTILEGSAVLNGRWIDGINTSSNPEISVADFDAVFVHEFGHYLDLDHSQINLTEAFDTDPGNDDAVATMFPILINPTAMATLALDDEVSISTLYPAPSFATNFGKITGNVFSPDGVSPFQGAYVVARKVGDPRLSAVGVASGDRFTSILGGSSDPSLEGLYEIPGLPPGSWTVEIEAIDPSFTGGSSVGPLDPPASLPGPPEFWNGANEAATNPPDDPTQAVPLTITAGTTTSGINIILNGVVCPPTPTSGCTMPIKAQAAKLQMRNTSPDDHDTITWKWGFGPASTPADFGNPLATTSYELCVYDEQGGVPMLVLSPGATPDGTCAGRPCWRSTNSGFSYVNRDRTTNGLSKITLRAGSTGKTRISLQGKGSALGLGSLQFVQDPAVIVQMLDSDGGCWEADFSAPAHENDAERFKDVSD
jgi:hypothetical protein